MEKEKFECPNPWDKIFNLGQKYLSGIPNNQEDLGVLKLSCLSLLFQLGTWSDKGNPLERQCGPMKWVRSNDMGAPQTPSIYWDPKDGVTKKVRLFCFHQMWGASSQLRPQKQKTIALRARTRGSEWIQPDTVSPSEEPKQRCQRLCNRKLSKAFFPEFTKEQTCLEYHWFNFQYWNEYHVHTL